MRNYLYYFVLFGSLLVCSFASGVEYSHDEYMGRDQEYKVLMVLEKIKQGSGVSSSKVAALKAMFDVELDILICRVKFQCIPEFKDYVNGELKRMVERETQPSEREKLIKYLQDAEKRLEDMEAKLDVWESWLINPPFDN